MDFEIRRERTNDIDGVYELNTASFETDDEAKLVNCLRKHDALTVSLVAVAGDAVIGHIAFSPVSVDGLEDRRKFVALGPMAVTPKFQGRGVGSALVRRGLKELISCDVSAVFVLGHARYYPRFGFKPAKSTYGISSTYEVADEYFMALELRLNSLNKIQGTLHYHPDFNGI